MEKTEVESKFELNEASFDTLLRAGRVRRCEEQLNIYYDSRWKLADASVTLRIRITEDGKRTLALKVPQRNRDAKRTMREFERELPEASTGVSSPPIELDVCRDLPVEMRGCLLDLGISQVCRVGWVRNTRVVLEIAESGEIELDRLRLPDGSTFLEAEIECDVEMRHDLLASFVRTYAPEAQPSRLSKFQRFREAASKCQSGNQNLL